MPLPRGFLRILSPFVIIGLLPLVGLCALPLVLNAASEPRLLVAVPRQYIASKTVRSDGDFPSSVFRPVSPVSGQLSLLEDTAKPGIHGFDLITANEGWLWLSQDLNWTLDAGRTWETITPSDTGNSTISAVSFLDPQTGWVVLSKFESDGVPSYTLARTFNSGRSWLITPLSLFAPGEVDAIAEAIFVTSIDQQTGGLVVKRATSSNFGIGTLFRTTDGGSTWTRLEIPSGEPVYFITDQIGWTTGGADRAFVRDGARMSDLLQAGESFGATVTGGTVTSRTSRLYRTLVPTVQH